MVYDGSMTTIKRRKTTLKQLGAIATEYFGFRSAKDKFSIFEADYKKKLMEILEQDGEEVEGGHRVLDLPDTIEYFDAKKAEVREVTGIERKMRVSTHLSEERTLALLARKNLLDQCTTTIVVVDEDAVLAANYADKITDAELAGLYDETENFAFYPVYG